MTEPTGGNKYGAGNGYIPVKVTDKNGNLVTRWVNPNKGGASESSKNVDGKVVEGEFSEADIDTLTLPNMDEIEDVNKALGYANMLVNKKKKADKDREYSSPEQEAESNLELRELAIDAAVKEKEAEKAEEEFIENFMDDIDATGLNMSENPHDIGESHRVSTAEDIYGENIDAAENNYITTDEALKALGITNFVDYKTGRALGMYTVVKDRELKALNDKKTNGKVEGQLPRGRAPWLATTSNEGASLGD